MLYTGFFHGSCHGIETLHHIIDGHFETEHKTVNIYSRVYQTCVEIADINASNNKYIYISIVHNIKQIGRQKKMY